MAPFAFDGDTSCAPTDYLDGKSPTEADNPPLGRHRMSESADEYPFVIAQLDERTRIIACKDDIQWIVQHRRGASWRGTGFFRTKAGLLGRCGSFDRTLAMLPDRYQEGHPGRKGGA